MYIPGWPRTHCVDHTVLTFMVNSPATAFQMLELEVCVATSALFCLFETGSYAPKPQACYI